MRLKRWISCHKPHVYLCYRQYIGLLPFLFHIYFAKSPIFAKYIGHRGLFVCLSVCLSFRDVQTTPLVRSSWNFDRWCLLYQGLWAIFWKSDIGQGQCHHFCENQIMAHNRKWQRLLVGCRTFHIKFRFCERCVDVRHHVLTSRDFNKFNENHIMGHNFWTGSGTDLWLAEKCSL